MKIVKHTYIQVLIAIAIAIIFGIINPSGAQAMKPLGDGFIKLIKMCVGPIIFCTVVGGFLGDKDLKVGCLSLKSLVYFEILTTLALIIGLAVAIFLKPGSSMNLDISTFDASDFASNAKPKLSFAEFLLNIIPTTIMNAFVEGEILPILFIAIIFGFTLAHIKDKVPSFIKIIEEFNLVIFKMISYIVKLAPIGAFGAMSYTIGKYGLASLLPLIKLIGVFYLTCILFIFIVLGTILKICNTSIFKLLKHIKEEIFIVLGTSSSETVLPQMIKKMENFGCKKSIVGFVIPAGYSFNLDGTCIYFTMAIMFLAQVFNIDLSIWQILQMIFILLITSKGAAGVVGSAFITLAATLSMFPALPVASLAFILGIDRFMSEARAVTNLIGNATATVAISKWENGFEAQKNIS